MSRIEKNPGIVPPWLQTVAAPGSSNPGIVPPWLQSTGRDRNPGIVPPWLVEDDVPKILPVNPDDEPRILPAPSAQTTEFVREPASYSPPTLVDALRAR